MKRNIKLFPLLAGMLLALAVLATGASAQVAYVTTTGGVAVIDTQTNQVVGEIPVTGGAGGAAMSPDGSTVYVASQEGIVAIDAQTNRAVGPLITEETPLAGNMVITPDGRTLFVTNITQNSVSVIDTQAKKLVGTIAVQHEPFGIAITPDGRTVYVTNGGIGTISVIDTQTNQVIKAIQLPYSETFNGNEAYGPDPRGIAITPDGRTAYVTNSGPGNVVTIDTQTNELTGSPIKIVPPEAEKTGPFKAVVTPDGKTVYVGSWNPGGAFRIDTQTNQVVGSPIPLKLYPGNMAITPDGRAVYVATVGSGPRGIEVIDTQTNQVTTEIPVAGGSIVIDPNGSSVVPPPKTRAGVRVRCPRKVRPGHCAIKLRALTGKKKGKGKALSAVARTKLKAGRSKIVWLKPRRAFAVRLERAKKLLIKQVVAFRGSTLRRPRRVLFRRLRVIHRTVSP